MIEYDKTPRITTNFDQHELTALIDVLSARLEEINDETNEEFIQLDALQWRFLHLKNILCSPISSLAG